MPDPDEHPAAGPVVQALEDLTGKLHDLATGLGRDDPRREAFFAARLLAEKTSWDVRRLLDQPTQPAVGSVRVVGEGSRRRIARHRADGGVW